MKHGALVKPRRKRLWMPLDNAAKIYPAARSRSWSNIFRLSATLREEIDKKTLESALAVTVERFPSIAAKLGTGLFWYYLEELDAPPPILEEMPSPSRLMRGRDMKRCALRILVYGRRLAVEFFHSIADGNSGLVFLKSLLAEYIEQKYGVIVPATDGVLDRREEPSAEELEDSFLKYSGKIPAKRSGMTAFHLRGTREAGGFVHCITFTASVSDVRALAKGYGVSITSLLTAALMQACLEIQAEKIRSEKDAAPSRWSFPWISGAFSPASP